MKSFLPLFAFFLLLLPGCQELRPDAGVSTSNPTFAWGLGLPIEGQPLPSPGPFFEGEENVTAFAARLNATFLKVLADCTVPPEHMHGLYRSMQERSYFAELGAVLEYCAGDLHDKELAWEAQRNGTEEQVWLELYARGRAAIDGQALILSRLRPPGNVLDAELQARLMGTNAWQNLALETMGRHSFEAYKEDGHELNLMTAYLNALQPIGTEHAFRRFVADYPWSNGTCTPPDVPALRDWLGWQIHSNLNRSFILEPPSPGFPVNEIYGAALKGDIPDLQYASERGWWPLLLTMVYSVTLDSAMLDTHQESRLPTREEARYLLAQHQHTRRTVDTEGLMQYFADQVDDGVSWDQHEFEARKALALPGMRSGFADLHCESANP